MTAINHRPDEHVSAARTDHRVTFAVLATGMCAYAFLQSVSVPTLPLIAEELGTDHGTATWILTAFLLSASVATPIIGRLGDSFGKRRMLVASLVALCVGSVAAAAAPTIETMIAARVLQGLGGGTIPLTFAIIRDELPQKRIPGALSLTSSLLAVGFAGGIVAAGPIVDWLGIHWLFLFPALFAAAAAIATRLLVPESPIRTRARVPLLPALLLAGWLVTLLMGVSRGPDWGWSRPVTVAMLVSAVVLFTLWVVAERSLEVPLIDLRLMSRRGVWSANLVALMIGMVSFGSLGFLPLLTQTPPENGYGFGASVTEAGHMMLPALAATFVCGMVAAGLAARIGIRAAIVIGCLIAAAGLAMVAFEHDHKWEMYVANGLAGLGSGLVFACLANAIVAEVPAEQTGAATGMNTNIRTIGGSIGIAVMTTVVTATLLSSGYPTERGYVVGFCLLAGAALMAAMAATMIPARNSGASVVIPPSARASECLIGQVDERP